MAEPACPGISATPAVGRTLIARYLPELALFALAVVLLGLWIARAPLLDPDEARYAAASRAMLDRGDLVVPYYNGAERLNKPALFYWMQAAAFRVLGPTEAAARLPSVCAAILAVLLVYGFAHRTLGRRSALHAGFILLTCPLFAIVGKTGITDMTLCLFITASLVFWFRLLSGIGNPRANWLCTSLALGLAFFVKGPVGIFVPCLVVGVFLVIRGEWRQIRLRPLLGGAIIAAAVVLPWGGLLVYRLGTAAAADTAPAQGADTNGHAREARARANSSSLAAESDDSRPTVPAASHGGPRATVPRQQHPFEAGLPGPHGTAVADSGPGATVGMLLPSSSDLPGPRSPSGGTVATGGGVISGAVHPASLAEVVLLGLGRVGALLRHETIERAITGLEHPRPIYFYLPAMLVVFFPWSLYLPFAVASTLPALRRRERDVLFFVVWFVVVLAVFTLVKGKLVTYILPAAPPMALLLARAWPRRHPKADVPERAQVPLVVGDSHCVDARQQRPDQGASGPDPEMTRPAKGKPTPSPERPGLFETAGWTLGGAIVVAAAMLALVVFAFTSHAAWLERYRFDLTGLAILVALAAVLPILLRRPQAGSFALAGAMACAIAVAAPLAGDEISGKRSLRALALETRIADRAWSRVIAYQLPRPSLVYYGHRTIDMAPSLRALRDLIEPDALVFMEERRFRDMRPSWQNAFRMVAVQDDVLAVSPISPLPPRGSGRLGQTPPPYPRPHAAAGGPSAGSGQVDGAGKGTIASGR